MTVRNLDFFEYPAMLITYGSVMKGKIKSPSHASLLPRMELQKENEVSLFKLFTQRQKS